MMRGLFPSRLRLFGLIAIAGGWALVLSPLPAKEVKPRTPKMKDLADTVLATRILTKFSILLRASDLASFLSSRGPFTLFAPTDSAFSRISPEIFAALQQPENKEVLQRVILFHVVNAQRLTAKDLQPLKTLPSCEGHPLPLRVNRVGYQIVSKAKIIHADIHCQNGLMHEIDTVLLPPGISLSALAAGAPPVSAAPPGSNGVAEPASPTNDVSSPGAIPASGATNSDAPTNAPTTAPSQ